MSLKELELLRSALVAKRHRLIPNSPDAGPIVKESDILAGGLPGSFQNIAIVKLTTNGFVHDSKLSQTGENFVRACTKDIDLAPAARGYKEWSNQSVAIISYELGDNRVVRRTMDVEGLLRKYQINSSIVAITTQNQQQVRMLSTHGLLLLGQNANGLEEHVQALAEFASKVPLLVVQMSEQAVALPAGVFVAKTIGYKPDFNEVEKDIIAAVLEFRSPPRT